MIYYLQQLIPIGLRNISVNFHDKVWREVSQERQAWPLPLHAKFMLD